MEYKAGMLYKRKGYPNCLYLCVANDGVSDTFVLVWVEDEDASVRLDNTMRMCGNTMKEEQMIETGVDLQQLCGKIYVLLTKGD